METLGVEACQCRCRKCVDLNKLASVQSGRRVVAHGVSHPDCCGKALAAPAPTSMWTYEEKPEAAKAPETETEAAEAPETEPEETENS